MVSSVAPKHYMMDFNNSGFIVSVHLLSFVCQDKFITLVNEYDQKILQSQTADKPVALRERVTQQSRETRKTNKA